METKLRECPPYSQRVHDWMLACFGAEIAADQMERNHRFLEEALELTQANGCTASEAHQLVGYVFGRPVGDPFQEVGGVRVTLAALCNAIDLNEEDAAEAELARVWTKVEQIRAKQAAKPKHSPLPARPEPTRVVADVEALREAVRGALPYLDQYAKMIEATAEAAIRKQIAQARAALSSLPSSTDEREKFDPSRRWPDPMTDAEYRSSLDALERLGRRGKRSECIGFVEGSLTVDTSGFGAKNGNGRLVFKDDDLGHEQDDGALYRVAEVEASELLAIRDFLNRIFPRVHLQTTPEQEEGR